MNAHAEKCHLLMNFMNVNRPATIKTGEHNISNGYCENVLGLKISNQLNFSNHIETFIKKVTCFG